ncbi:MAG: phosphopyruvate hydratase [Sulfobacillus benefaciens]|uniref:Enolase n=1 Tax=Sulfobacillus benefaciens TaxID=453960 RepID=A0A2T2WV59_9FIRM|nr:MAG: phosphopyruvate hydratase [Sulfobacillus benefaciens]
MSDLISGIHAYEILDSRGNPTLAVRVDLQSGQCGWARVPSGASTGAHEAVELRDRDTRYQGKGVRTACRNVNEIMAPALVGMRVQDQAQIDQLLRDLDGDPQKARLGANACLGVSLGVLNAAANSLNIPLYRYIGGTNSRLLPVPLLNVVNGGVHADNNVDIQEFMLVPAGASSFAEAMRMAVETYHALKSLLQARGLRTAVGDEGGFAPDLDNDREVLDFLVRAIEKAGLVPGQDVALAIDVAANELRTPEGYRLQGKPQTADDLIDFYQEVVQDYPVISIEDGLAEDDWDGWARLQERLGSQTQLIGDDLFVTNPARIRQGMEQKSANAVLIKLNQIGTVSETLEAIAMSQAHGWHTIVSHRSGETEDTAIADLSVAMNTGQIKTGAPARSERVAKYNRLLIIEADDAQLQYAGWGAFGR